MIADKLRALRRKCSYAVLVEGIVDKVLKDYRPNFEAQASHGWSNYVIYDVPKEIRSNGLRQRWFHDILLEKSGLEAEFELGRRDDGDVVAYRLIIKW
jgi:hypothetical protein